MKHVLSLFSIAVIAISCNNNSEETIANDGYHDFSKDPSTLYVTPIPATDSSEASLDIVHMAKDKLYSTKTITENSLDIHLTELTNGLGFYTTVKMENATSGFISDWCGAEIKFNTKEEFLNYLRNRSYIFKKNNTDSNDYTFTKK